MVVIAIVVVLASLLFQGGSWLRGHAEAATLLARAGHLGSALQMYYQKHRTYPEAFPANLGQDLAPYVDNQDAFSVPAHEGEGAGPLNASYVPPVQGDCNSYILSLDSKHYGTRAAVLFSNLTAQIVDKLSIKHNGAAVVHGTVVEGGTVEFGNGSIVQLSDSTSARLVHSFTAADGTSFNIVKMEAKGVSASATGIAVDTDIIEIAAHPGIVFLRSGVVDAEVIPQSQNDQLQVTTRSGEVRVIGRTMASGQSVADAIENNPVFDVDDDQFLVATQDCVAEIKVLGKAITYGAGGPDCAVKAGVSIVSPDSSGSQAWEWMFGGNQVYGGETFSQEIVAGTRLAVKGRASYGSWAREYASTDDHQQVLVLRDGDTPPQFAPFDGQPEITTFLAPVLDTATGKINIEDHQAVVLFELGTTNMSSSAADFQDLVLLVDFAATGASGGAAADPADEGNDEPVENYNVNIEPDNTITVQEDCSLAVRVLGMSLKNSSGNSVPITMKIKIDGTWRNLRHGNKMYTNYKYKREINAGSTIKLKATSCNGSDSASYHSADGTGHVLNAIRDEIPEPFGREEPVPIKSLMSRAVDTDTGLVTLAPHQILMMYELACEDTADPDATFQDIAVVLTFMPQSLHGQNRNSTNFDGYQDNVMGEGAQAFAGENEFAWTVGRVGADNADEGGSGDEGGVDDEEEEEYTDDGSNTQSGEMKGQTTRTLSRGICVPTGRWVRVVSHQ